MARRYFKTILAGIEFPLARRQLALKRASQLARRTGARLILFHSAFVPTPLGSRFLATFDRLVESTLAERSAALRKMAAPLRRQGLKVTVKTVWDFPSYESIVRETLRSKPDLVVVESPRHSLGARLFLTHTDWQLIRLCPAPLLFVKQAKAWGKARVLAAVDPLHRNAKPARLDERILEVAQAMAEAHSGKLDVAHAYLPLVHYMAGGFDDVLVAPVNQEAEREYERFIKKTLDRCVAPLDLPPQRLHLKMGITHSVLPDLARRMKTDVIVMGAISRRGLKRLFLGNTAESTIDAMPCDVLVIKPRRFKTTVPRRSTLGPLPTT